MAKPLNYNATLSARIDLTKELSIFKITLDEPLKQGFVPGQYLTIGLNNEQYPALGSVRRPMSVGSAPEQGEELEFYIRYVNHPESDNPLTHLLWPRQSGDRLFVRPKAVGHFTLSHTLKEGDKRNKVYVAAGTGLAPFISILRHQVLTDPTSNLSDQLVLHGVSYPQDLGYRSELETYAETCSLGYLPTVSRPHEVAGWSGAVGRVEDFFLPERIVLLESTLNLAPGEMKPDNTVIYICGLQGTIGCTIERLLHRGFVPDNRKLRRALQVDDAQVASLFFEQYDATPAIDIDDAETMATLRETLKQALN